MTSHVQSVADSAALSRAASMLFSSAAVIAEQTLAVLDPERRAAIDIALANGATLCVEAGIDVLGMPRAVLTVVKADGARHEVASVHVPDRAGVR